MYRIESILVHCTPLVYIHCIDITIQGKEITAAKAIQCGELLCVVFPVNCLQDIAHFTKANHFSKCAMPTLHTSMLEEYFIVYIFQILVGLNKRKYVQSALSHAL